MEEFWLQLLSILVLLHQTGSASDPTELIGAVGGSVTFRTHSTEGNAAFWSFGNDPIVAVEFEDPSKLIFHHNKYKTRFTVSEKGRALGISQLSMEDAGTYSVTIGDEKSTFTLHVYRELAEPRVSCESQNCSGRICLFSLRCSVPGTGFGNVSYTWRVWDRVWEGERLELEVNKSSLDDADVHPRPLTCTARNGVGSRNVTVSSPGGLCSENSTNPLGPGALQGSSFGIGIIGAIGVLVVFLVVLIFFCKSKGWRKFHLPKSKPTDTAATAESTTVYAEVGPSQQRIPNGIKAKPAGAEPSTTIYSLVKRPERVGDGAEENATVTGLELV